jgi:phosphopantothenoylcysteine decarboxylase / phosphopantothenate---cysteine ligase
MLKGKKILIGITGSIAAYKIPLLVRLLVKAGAEVKVVMTAAAADFVSPLTLATLCRQPVLSNIHNGENWANHVMLGRWADVMLIAPLSCNTLAKMVGGQCDNLLLAVYLSATCPVVVAPAMDEDMWHHPATKRNIKQLTAFGVQVLPVENGELASGLIGEGRMAEPETMLAWLQQFFTDKSRLSGKKVLITAGPTYEAIDPVRFIGNRSSGKMGIALANVLQAMGATVTLVIGPTAEPLPGGVTIVAVQSAQEMYDACISRFADMDMAIMSAAVADYTPADVSPTKIKKSEGTLQINLTKTKDILFALGQLKKDNQLLVGFALETNNEEEYAMKKLTAKNADIIILNSLQNAEAGFGVSTNCITIFDKRGHRQAFDVKPKTAVATDIVNYVIQYLDL